MLAAVLGAEPSLRACDVEVPGCPSVQLAIDAEGGLLLLTALGSRLEMLAELGWAMSWARENYGLLCRVFPRIRTLPRARVYVDARTGELADLSSLMRGGEVELHRYRQVRWGDRRGLLLEAA